MVKKISAEVLYERVRELKPIGVRQNRLYLREGSNWKAVTSGELAIEIRALY